MERHIDKYFKEYCDIKKYAGRYKSRESFEIRRKEFWEDGENVMDLAKEPCLLEQFKRQSVYGRRYSSKEDRYSSMEISADTSMTI